MKTLKVIILILSLSIVYAIQEWKNISPFPESNDGVIGDFISAKIGWAHSGHNLSKSSLFYTNDGGSIWNKIYVLEDSLESIMGVYMIDSLNGWVSKVWQNNQFPYNSINYNTKTNDGGYSWEDMSSYIPDEREPRSFYFINRDIGFFAAGYDSLDHSAIIYKTINGGCYWY